MPSIIVEKSINKIISYLNHLTNSDALTVFCELEMLTGVNLREMERCSAQSCSYEELQRYLSIVNEKEGIRKERGVYYTPSDVAQFVLKNTTALSAGDSSRCDAAAFNRPTNDDFCALKRVFDPTCGAGEFLLAAFNLKLDILSASGMEKTAEGMQQIAASIFGNDINRDSIVITMLRLLLCVVERCGAAAVKGLASILLKNFSQNDYIQTVPDETVKYDMIVGNPPYVEDAKSGMQPKKKYGNIYANVMENAVSQLNDNGVIGFILPLSYIATPRMHAIRAYLLEKMPLQYLLSYADRPDCLFSGVHQKLCILIGVKTIGEQRIYTGNYQYWYREERDALFTEPQMIQNKHATHHFIPKLGTQTDVCIYEKVTNPENKISIYSASRVGQECVSLNRRETFWMKAYRKYVENPEYKVFCFPTAGEADFCYCLVQSSLFWWYWIAVSDCWHVSKDLNGFAMPIMENYAPATELAQALIRRLEETKVYVGTKQTQYAYKHRACTAEIRAIDDYINALFGLSAEESAYIGNFAFRYRTSGGAEA